MAVKQRIPFDPGDRREQELFEREEQFIFTLRGSGTLEIFDYFSEQCFQFILMQFIEGRSLGKVQTGYSGILKEADALPLMTEALAIEG